MPRIIKNASQLAVTPQRKTALAILEAGYRAIQIKKILKTTVLKEGGVLKIKGKTYDLVLNGTEISSGSIRIHRPDLQKKVFELFGVRLVPEVTYIGFPA